MTEPKLPPQLEEAFSKVVETQDFGANQAVQLQRIRRMVVVAYAYGRLDGCLNHEAVREALTDMGACIRDLGDRYEEHDLRDEEEGTE